jgi:hypothetical protein
MLIEKWKAHQGKAPHHRRIHKQFFDLPLCEINFMISICL